MGSGRSVRGSGPIKGPSATFKGQRGKGQEPRDTDEDRRVREGTEGCPRPKDQG